MSLSQSIRRLTEGLRRVRREAEARDERIAALEAQLRSGEARAKAVAVPPGSTYFAGDQIRQVRVTEDSTSGTETFSFVFQTPDESGAPIDEDDNSEDMVARKTDPAVSLTAEQIVGVTIEGTDGEGEAVYWLAAAPATAGATPMRVNNVADGVIYASPITGVNPDGSEQLGDETAVALPQNLRVDAANYNYVGSIRGISGIRAEIVSSGADGSEAGISEVWRCIPRYEAGGIIFAVDAGYTRSSAAGQQVTLVDLNVDARAWVATA